MELTDTTTALALLYGEQATHGAVYGYSGGSRYLDGIVDAYRAHRLLSDGMEISRTNAEAELDDLYAAAEQDEEAGKPRPH